MTDTFKDQPVIAFDSQAAWRAWLAEHHATHQGLWLRIYKKGSVQPTVTYAQALDEALCYGWIDSTKGRYDDESFIQRFTPRKPRSVWSKVNREHVARLIASGQMTPAGEHQIELAKANGQWEAAYDSFSRSTVPADFEAVLAAHPEARAFYDTLSQTNKYALLYRIQSVKKPETRIKRIAWALELLLKRETVH